MMMGALAKQKAKAEATEECVEASGGVQAGEKPVIKKKPKPKEEAIGMQAMLLQEAVKKGNKLQQTPKAWGVQRPSATGK